MEAGLRAAFPPGAGTALHRGATWTTNAPYRETAATALYALAAARGLPITCIAHVTNTMGQQAGNDLEKGEAGGSVTALRVIKAAAGAFREARASAAG